MERKRQLTANPFHYCFNVLKFFFLAVIVFLCIYVPNRLNFSRFFPIHNVRIYGGNHVDKHEVENLLTPLLTRGFFKVKVDNIRDRLLQLPWSSDIIVQRNWPDNVNIQIIEKKPIALWNQISLLSDGGELFAPSLATYPSDLPNFIGPQGKQIVMIHYYMAMNRILSPLHAKISTLELTPFYSWKLTLDNGMTVRVGHKNIITRLNQFVRVYPKIVGERSGDVEYIDLRYPNGIAVRWKDIKTA